MIKILVVDDNISMREILEEAFIEAGYYCKTSETAENAIELIHKNYFEIIITDLKLPGINGIELLKKINSLSPESVVIVMTAFGTIEEAVESMKHNAFDFILKPFKISEIEFKVKKIINNINLKIKSDYLEEEIEHVYDYKHIIGSSDAMKNIFKRIDSVAATSSTILIRGETGTGKELIARAIHYKSSRKNMPFIKVNCAALAPGILASELFGHVKGAFTGAVNNYKGRFELADKGTLFLDEIGDLSPEIQVKLLRVLQEKEIERVGSGKTIKIDVRLITATNKNIEKLIKEQKFREDLYYRLNVIPINVPHLKDRQDDIIDLTNFFIKKYSNITNKKVEGIDDEALKYLYDYEWTGNVRELENIIERMIVLSNKTILTSNDIPIEIKNSTDSLFAKPKIYGNIDNLPDYLANIEKQILIQALNSNDWNQTQSAKKLGISRTDLQYKMKKYNLKPK